MEDALDAAMKRSFELFPETWVTVRGMVHRPWDQNDIALALGAAESAAQLRQDYRWALTWSCPTSELAELTETNQRTR